MATGRKQEKDGIALRQLAIWETLQVRRHDSICRRNGKLESGRKGLQMQYRELGHLSVENGSRRRSKRRSTLER